MAEIGRNVTGVRGDVSRVRDLDSLFARIGQEKGKLDIVFANAGIAKLSPLGTVTEEFFDSIFDTNVKGLLFYGSESSSAAERRCLDHLERLNRRQQRTAGQRCL